MGTWDMELRNKNTRTCRHKISTRHSTWKKLILLRWFQTSIILKTPHFPVVNYTIQWVQCTVRNTSEFSEFSVQSATLSHYYYIRRLTLLEWTLPSEQSQRPAVGGLHGWWRSSWWEECRPLLYRREGGREKEHRKKITISTEVNTHQPIHEVLIQHCQQYTSYVNTPTDVFFNCILYARKSRDKIDL